VCAGGVDAVVVATRDRLARFGAGALERVLERHACRLEVVDAEVAGSDGDFEGRLVRDVLALVTSFAGKLHRRRRGRNANAGGGAEKRDPAGAAPPGPHSSAPNGGRDATRPPGAETPRDSFRQARGGDRVVGQVQLPEVGK
ncbi:MAG: recombinase family protein, partial [Promethearchaeota archaeon]